MDDPSILEWAASQQRILISHDIKTMTAFAYERIAQSKAMPGVIVLTTSSIGQAIDELLTRLAN